MKTYAFVLKIIAPLFVLVGVLHLVLGPGADVLLGAQLSAEVLSDPVLDSQNRFLGVAFALYGVLLYVCAKDLGKYAVILKCVFWVFFIAGVARLVSIALVGMPTLPVVGLLVSEVVLPPILLVWFARLSTDKP